MRGSSPALALVPRPTTAPRARSVPRPRPRVVPPPRLSLASVDLEDVDERDEAPRSTIPPPLPSRARRYRSPISTPPTSHPELLDEVVAALGDLPSFETMVEAVSCCVVTAMQAIPSLAGLAVMRDDARGGYVVVYARGPRAYEVVRTRVAEDDAAIAAARTSGGPVSVEYGSDRAPPERHAHFGDPWTVFVAPAQSSERCLGVIELVDPIDGRAMGDSARHALATIARGLAEFAKGRTLSFDNVYAPEHLGLED